MIAAICADDELNVITVLRAEYDWEYYRRQGFTVSQALKEYKMRGSTNGIL